MVLGQLLAVIPGHPRGRIGRQLGGVALQLAEIVESIGASQFAGVDQAHEQVAYLRTVQRAIEQGVFAMQHGALERAFTDVVVQGRTRLAQKGGQSFPVAQK